MPPDLEGPLLRRIIDVVPRAIVVTDAAGSIRLWSDAARHLYGWAEPEVLGRSIFEILDPDQGLDYRPEMLEALLSGAEVHRHLRVLHRDGSRIDVASFTRALLGPDGQIELVVGATDDLAAVAELQRETRDLSDHLRLALDAGGFGTWRWDLATGVTTWDPEMERLFGLEPGTFDGTFDAWRALLHPDDVEHVLAVVDDAVANRSHYRLEHRVVTPEGQVRWIEGAGRVTLDADGNVAFSFAGSLRFDAGQAKRHVQVMSNASFAEGSYVLATLQDDAGAGVAVRYARLGPGGIEIEIALTAAPSKAVNVGWWVFLPTWSELIEA